MRIKTIHRILSAFLIMVLLTTSMLPKAYAISVDTVTLTAQTVTGAPNSTIEVDIIASGGAQIGNGEFNVVYDNTKLELLSAVKGAALPSDVAINKNYSANTVRVAFMTLDTITGTGCFLKLSFKIKPDAPNNTTATVALQNVKMWDDSGTLMTSSITNGNITICNDKTVSFAENGGSSVSDITIERNSSINSAPTTTKTGYTFAGWYLNSGLTTAVSFPYVVTDNATFYAKWTAKATPTTTPKATPTPTAKTYTITYNGNGNTGGTVPADSKKYTQSQSAIVQGADTLVKTGYSFIGWSTNKSDTAASYTAGSSLKIGTANTTLYAVWKKIDAKTVEEVIKQLPTGNNITVANKDDIFTAYKKYIALSAEEKAKVSQETVDKLNKDIKELTKLLLYDAASKTSVDPDTVVLDVETWLYVKIENENIDDKMRSSVDSIKKSHELIALYNIKLKLNDQDIQPNGDVTVRLFITEDLRKYENLQVIYINDNGEVQVITSTRDGDYLVFKTDHFSNYGIIGTKIAAQNNIPYIPIAIAAVVLIGLFIIVVKRRKKKED